LQRESPRDILQEDLLHHRKQQQKKKKKPFPQNDQFNTGKDNYKTEKAYFSDKKEKIYAYKNGNGKGGVSTFLSQKQNIEPTIAINCTNGHFLNQH